MRRSPLCVFVVATAIGLVQDAHAKKAAAALEASFKARITEKITNSLAAASKHLVGRLTADGKSFSGYELDFEPESSWRQKCMQIDTERDSIENCALRQLHALAALCDSSYDLQSGSDTRKLVDAHLKSLVSKDVANLAIKRTKFDGVDIWFHRKSPQGSSDDIDASPVIQASALMALTRCANATEQRDYFLEAENWFTGLAKVYPQKMWNSTLVNFHKSGIIWESLALVISHIPADSSFYSKLLQYVKDFETFLYGQWSATPETWSFASARALALRYQSKSLKGKKNRAFVRKWAQEHVDRFLGVNKGSTDVSQGILQRIGGAGYTCGPLQGLTSLAAITSDPGLVSVVLKLLEKDIDRYQIRPVSADQALADAEDALIKIARDAGLEGSFIRDKEQMKMERRRSFRIDDVVQCMVALSQALKTLENIQAVVLNQDGSTGEAAAPEGERSAEL